MHSLTLIEEKDEGVASRQPEAGVMRGPAKLFKRCTFKKKSGIVLWGGGGG